MKRIIAIGGGEIKNKTTLKIDEYVATLINNHAEGGRGNMLFIGTASHDSMPYFNSFRKTYTSVFDIKAEVALIVYGEMDLERIATKIENADGIYIGGGDTVYMLEKWKESGLLPLIMKAYEDGKIICGLSAGAICWFNTMYTDFEIMRGTSSEYTVKQGLGVLGGAMCPHFNEREKDFFQNLEKGIITETDIYAVENDCALEFVDVKLTKSISAGGKAYKIVKEDGKYVKIEI